MADNINYNSGEILTYFGRFDAAPHGVQQQLDDVTATGVDGVGYRKAAKRPPAFQGRTEVYTDTFANAAALRAIYESLVGKLVTLIVQGVTYANILVLAPVEVDEFQMVAKAFYVTLPNGTTSTGTNAVRITARWTFVYAGTP